MVSNLRALISLHEGRVPYAYQDSTPEKYWTIGVGHLVDPRKGGRLPEHIIDLLLDYDIEKAQAELVKALPWAVGLDPVRLAVMTDMEFNLGNEPFDGDGYKDWPMFVGQVRTRQWDKAADNMLGTKWAGQVGKRALRLATMMRTGLWPVS